jgi:hypothetical protein
MNLCKLFTRIKQPYPCDGCVQKLREAAWDTPPEKRCWHTCPKLKEWEDGQK